MIATWLGITGGSIVAVIGLVVLGFILVSIVRQLRASAEEDAKIARMLRRRKLKGQSYREGRR